MISSIADNEVTWDVIFDLGEDDLKELVPKIGKRIAFQKALKKVYLYTVNGNINIHVKVINCPLNTVF